MTSNQKVQAQIYCKVVSKISCGFTFKFFNSLNRLLDFSLSCLNGMGMDAYMAMKSKIVSIYCKYTRNRRSKY
jgi:hypothetical protein